MPETPRRALSSQPSTTQIRTPPTTRTSNHISTPSSSYFTTNFKAGMSSSSSRSRMRPALPRAVARGLVVLLGLIGVVVLSQAASRDVAREEGRWDASSWSERRGVDGGLGAMRSKFRYWGSGEQDPAPFRPVNKPRPPTLSRAKSTSPPSIHPGKSRRLRTNSTKEEYDLAPLPTLEEAFAFLHPLLRKVKEDYPHIPREHELTAPIFSPYITDELRERYRHLVDDWDTASGDWVRGEERRWYLVTICRQVAGMLADWFAMWTVLADFLGPESLVFSLLEGDSADGSGEILSQVMRTHLLNIGVPPENIFIQTHLPAIEWEEVHRIEQLSEMRNSGMQPFYDTLPEGLSPDGHPWTGIVFYNDVYLSAQHFLELMHQHFKQDADMTCGWDHAGRWFYDGWVGRDMSGDLYTPFPVKEEDKDLPQKLFPSHHPTLQRYERMLPFQVFAGWNGITVLSPTPFMPPYNVRFRRAPPRTDEDWQCQASESSLISWDFWRYGFGRIAVVPGVHATYGKEDAMARGWLEWPNEGDGMSEQIQWNDMPPGKVRCHDWPDKPGKGWWAWDTVRWVSPPALEIPKGR